MGGSQAERQLILLSAGTVARRQTMHERVDPLIAHVNWKRLGETLRSRKLLPRLGPRILELTEDVSDDFVSAVEESVVAGRRQGALLQLVSLRLMSALAEQDILCSALKGPMLGEAIYGDPGRRPSSDIDLLVSAEQLSAAVEVVREMGYHAPTDYTQDCGLPLLHFVLIHERGELPTVELHWRVHWYERSFARERLLPPVESRADNWHPGPADELASLLLFYARDGFIDLRLATDLGAWWDVYGSDLPGGALDEVLQSFPSFGRVIPTAAVVAERVVGLPANQIVIDRPKPGIRERMAWRLANPNPDASSSQLYADMGLVDGLLMPAGGSRAFVRRQILPPRAVLIEQARHAAKSRPRSALGHCAGVLARYGLTIARAWRSPEALR